MTFIRFIIVSIFIFAGISSAFAEEAPYKATTEEECIQEKECVWYAFSKMIGLDEENFSLIKWKQQIDVHAAGPISEQTRWELANTLNVISKALPIPVHINNNFNILVFFSDDFEKDILGKYKSEFIKNFGEQAIQKFKNRNKNAKCFSIDIENINNNEKLLSKIFIPATGSERQYCLESQFFSALGFKNKIALNSWTINSDPMTAKIGKSNITLLDILLIKILYHPNFQTGMTSHEVTKTFEKVFNNFYDN